jgi:hypothetical protein
VWYSYALIRVVPRVERGECMNAGVILFCRPARFLEARVDLDEARLRALDPTVDVAEVRRHLDAFVAISTGAGEPGQVANYPQSERFHSLTAPRSTMIQPSPVHVGRSDDLAATLEELLDTYVRPPRPAPTPRQPD